MSRRIAGVQGIGGDKETISRFCSIQSDRKKRPTSSCFAKCTKTPLPCSMHPRPGVCRIVFLLSLSCIISSYFLRPSDCKTASMSRNHWTFYARSFPLASAPDKERKTERNINARKKTLSNRTLVQNS